MQQVLAYLEANRDRYLSELKEFLAIPSVSSQTDHVSDMRRCAEWIAQELRKIGMQNTQIMDTPGHPVVFGEWLGAPGKPTVLL